VITPYWPRIKSRRLGATTSARTLFRSIMPDAVSKRQVDRLTSFEARSGLSSRCLEKLPIRGMFNKLGSLRYKKTRNRYNVKRSSLVPQKYHYFLTQSPSILMHLSYLGTSLKIPSRQKSGCCIHIHPQTAIYTSSLL
jgi:hypothetical protein